MSYEFYKIAHVLGLVTLFASLGALALVGPERRKPFMILHGVAMAVMLVAGFGLLARLGMMGNLGLWVYLKLGIWLILGGWPTLQKKKPALALPLLLATIVLGALAASFAILKPGA